MIESDQALTFWWEDETAFFGQVAELVERTVFTDMLVASITHNGRVEAYPYD